IAGEAADRVSDGAVVRTDHLAQIFRVIACRQRCRADEITEHDGELAPLRVGARRLGQGWRRLSTSLRDRLTAAPAEPCGRFILETASRAGNEQSRAALSAEAARLRVFGHAARAAHKVLRGGDRSPQPYLKGGRLRSQGVKNAGPTGRSDRSSCG